MPAPGSHLLTYEQIETSLSRLEESLKITPEQNKAWGNFATKVRSYASDIARERARLNNESSSSGDALKYLSQSAEDAKTRYTSLKEIDEAAKPLYKILSTEQKTVFDNRVSSFVAATPKRLGNSQPNLNLPDFGASPTANQNSSSNSLPGYIHQ
jgi:chromosome segregation ATPase